ncbi:MAG TPA: hypothetical protein GX706_03785 [Candidatus Moranbacteria bacterium]|nr:hypothetical protein [Candidatus Moranbacteria bacterium]
MKRILMFLVALAVLLSLPLFVNAASADKEYNQRDRDIFYLLVTSLSQMEEPDFSKFKEFEVRTTFGKVFRNGEMDRVWFRWMRDRLGERDVFLGEASPEDFPILAKVYPAAYCHIFDGKKVIQFILIPSIPPIIFME